MRFDWSILYIFIDEHRSFLGSWEAFPWAEDCNFWSFGLYEITQAMAVKWEGGQFQSRLEITKRSRISYQRNRLPIILKKSKVVTTYLDSWILKAWRSTLTIKSKEYRHVFMDAVFFLVSFIFYILIRIVAHSFFEKHFEWWPLGHRWDSRGYMNGTSSWYWIVSFWIDYQEVLGVQEATKIQGIKQVKSVRKIENPWVNKQFRVMSIGIPISPQCCRPRLLAMHH